jgi:hypothetical protein
MQIPGQTIAPEGNGRLPVEPDHTVHDGAPPDSAGRAQVRYMRVAD